MIRTILALVNYIVLQLQLVLLQLVMLLVATGMLLVATGANKELVGGVGGGEVTTERVKAWSDG